MFHHTHTRHYNTVSFMARVITLFWFLIALSILGASGYIAITLFSLDWSGGIQPLLNNVWCGSATCFNE